MKKNEIRGLIVLAILVAVFSVIAFVVPFERNSVFWTAYGFGVAAIIVQAFAMKSAFGGESPKSKYYGFPVAKVSVTYLLIQMILSIVFMAFAKYLPMAVAAVVCVVLLAIALIGFIAVNAAREAVIKQETVCAADTSAMKFLKEQAKLVSGLTENQDVKMLAAELQYSDPVSSEATNELEEQLRKMIGKVRSLVMAKEEQKAGELAKEMLMVLKERNAMCKAGKGI